MGVPLLGRKQREEGGKRIEGKRLPRCEDQVLALNLEAAAFRMIAYHRAVSLDDLDPEVPELERIVTFHVLAFLSGVTGRPYCGAPDP
jgi:hypothetical protein